MSSYTVQAIALVLLSIFGLAIGAAVPVSPIPAAAATPNLSAAISSLTAAKATRTLTSVARKCYHLSQYGF
jgi:hypothetical protein